MGKCGDWELYKTSSGRYSLYYNKESVRAGLTSDTAYYYWIHILKKCKAGDSDFSEMPIVKQKEERKKSKKKKAGEEEVSDYFWRQPGNVNLDILTGISNKPSSFEDPRKNPNALGYIYSEDDRLFNAPVTRKRRKKDGVL